jgi:hypothetical protein
MELIACLDKRRLPGFTPEAFDRPSGWRSSS